VRFPSEKIRKFALLISGRSGSHVIFGSALAVLLVDSFYFIWERKAFVNCGKNAEKLTSVD